MQITRSPYPLQLSARAQLRYPKRVLTTAQDVQSVPHMALRVVKEFNNLSGSVRNVKTIALSGTVLSCFRPLP
jgi:hypothetical protein